MNRRVAALLVEYRSPERTIACIAALLSQGVDTVIVVDNSDDQRLTLGRLRCALQDEPRVRLHDAGGNLGFAAGVNRGLSMLEADRVLLINNDALPDPGLVSGLAEALESEPDAAIAFPTLQHAGAVLEEVYYHRWFAMILRRRWPGAFSVPRGCCMLVARDRLPSGALFDEAFFMYGEEIELGWRLRGRPRALIHVSSCRVMHEGSAAAGRGSRFYEERTAAAHLLLTKRLVRSGLERPFIVPVRGLALLLRACVRTVRAGSPMPLLALSSARAIAAGATGAATPPPR